MVMAANPVEQARKTRPSSLASLRFGLALYNPVRAKITIQPVATTSTNGQYLFQARLKRMGRIAVTTLVKRNPYAENPANINIK